MTDMPGASAEASPASGDDTPTLDDLRREMGDRWQVAKITGGYRATIKGPGGTPIPRYGRTPGELLESIRHVEGRP
jgi:hypothetical protein